MPASTTGSRTGAGAEAGANAGAGTGAATGAGAVGRPDTIGLVGRGAAGSPAIVAGLAASGKAVDRLGEGKNMTVILMHKHTPVHGGKVRKRRRACYETNGGVLSKMSLSLTIV